MFTEILLASALQVGPFYEENASGDAALRPFWSCAGETTDVLWPLFTSHRDWWRFCFFIHEQDYPDGGYQFEVMPFWFNGHDASRTANPDTRDYWGLVPFWGHHPHILTVYDLDFAFWPLWHRYRMPRAGGTWMTTHAVLFPFIHWRSDGSWGFWPFYVKNHQRESLHQTALWPFLTWANYEEDRDTGGAGSSWMLWPLYGRVRRAREEQDLFLPPFFSLAKTLRKQSDINNSSRVASVRLRCPWPLIECECAPHREHFMFFPIWERTLARSYTDGSRRSRVDRFGWRLVELYDDETRVFPFWTSRTDGSYFRLWPFWESVREGEVSHGRFLSLFPIRWVPSIDRNWAKFWTFYERETNPVVTHHALFWGLVRWRTLND